MKNLSKLIFYRIVLAAIAIIAQIVIFFIVVTKFNNYIDFYFVLSGVLSFFVVLFIVNKNMNPEYKIAWTVPILLFPIFGWLLYFMLGGNRLSKRLKRKMNYVKEKSFDMVDSIYSNRIISEIEQNNKDAANQAKYILNSAYCPPYKNDFARYFPTGEEMYASIIEELKKAERFIFIEFFIIAEGIMWEEILNILKQKAESGIDVRVIYDDMGCITTLPYNYKKTLQSFGIKCSVFNPFIPTVNSRLNTRDHRKIIVIDGKCAYTGGINIADEYINKKVRFGYWKDGGILIKGTSVYSFTVMFLTVWDYLNNSKEKYHKYKSEENNYLGYDGYIQPYSSGPINEESVGEDVYLNLISKAKKYLYIATPYLILDYQMQTALCLSAIQGVDIRIVTPHIPDKKSVYMLTKNNYKKLIKSGIKIYEYTPGFIHSKLTVSDDIFGTVGTINFDYRSLYLHFECGVWMFDTRAVLQIKEDFLNMFEHCRQITLKDCDDVSIWTRIIRSFLRMFASLM